MGKHLPPEELASNDATRKITNRWNYQKTKCITCKGTGKYHGRECGLCHGKKWIWTIP